MTWIGVGQNLPISRSPVPIFTSQTFTHEKDDHSWIIEISWLSWIGDPGWGEDGDFLSVLENPAPVENDNGMRF
jgi:hypothetical protein